MHWKTFSTTTFKGNVCKEQGIHICNDFFFLKLEIRVLV